MLPLQEVKVVLLHHLQQAARCTVVLGKLAQLQLQHCFGNVTHGALSSTDMQFRQWRWTMPNRHCSFSA